MTATILTSPLDIVQIQTRLQSTMTRMQDRVKRMLRYWSEMAR